MKKINTLFATICLSLLFTTNTKAQDDPNCGFVVDGVLVDSITSWALGDLSVVFPMKQSWKKYDLIQGYIFLTNKKDSYAPVLLQFEFKPEDLDEYSDAKYAVYNIFKKGAAHEVGKKYCGIYGYCNDCKSGGEYNTKPESDKKFEFSLVLSGHKITSYIETYTNNTKVKQPLYDGGRDNRGRSLQTSGEVLYETKPTPYKVCFCSYDKKTYKKVTDINACDECKIDFSKQAVQPGKKFTLNVEKVDFKGVFGKITGSSSSSSNTKTEVKTNTTETKTTVTKTATTKTSTSSGALTASALKPLDKSKAGYFVEKDGSQIIQEGYKKGDARNGEVRVYDEGKLRSVTTYANDEKNGAAALYYANGNLEESGNYKNDNKEGEWKRYTEAGKLAGTDVYVDGEKQ
ncbi:MAG: hypothetical protein A3K10_03650 [Bacteroidetes bacterium RIFCSPLOWO2_12_FULL_31_6]|nr:MAG: hypothetical protein A3K10_03650 [Bacteroidetes bacterium RIFCSPLOWO2_12_FULL_31_6]